ncbi:class III lanthionine synthetase LanKC [Streptomyces sp. LS1784]|uniref:class III lanthionine synthetase LanKC n=1 Tax=Streptomyces sp. LS1784 TaxID=2851533 RepID=UPI001CCD993B|nr:class III lanthionine synthetase LanKC [Streptomyces sp. LS1784]
MTDLQATQMYCLVDGRFYDAPYRMDDAATRFEFADAPVPDGWFRRSMGLWELRVPQGHRLPDQGWKIHVAAVQEEAADTLDRAARICFRRGVPFKFLRSLDALRITGAAHAAREGSGKFITVYPPSETRFGTLVEDLVSALDGREAPFILTDLRIGSSPVHVRYGAFRLLCRPGPDGRPLPVLRGPGGYEPDERRPVFRTPSWVTMPDILVPHLTARETVTQQAPPFVVEEALHFTNSGGIYLATDARTGERLVLREARPYSGLDRFGLDARTRLRHEFSVLGRLAGVGCVPEVLGLHEVWGHLYLAEEYIAGESLLRAVVARNPLVWVSNTRRDLLDYARWVRNTVDRVRDALAAVHARGLAYGDLHPANIIVRPDGSLALVDFEYAADLDDPDAPRPGAAGFTPPRHLSAAEADLRALDLLKLWMLLPMTEIGDLDPGKAATLLRLAEDRFPDIAPGKAPEPDENERTVRLLFGVPATDAGWLESHPADPDGPALCRALVAGIHATATPDRTDRLFPGGPEAFAFGGHTFAHGAAGVLAALRRVGEPVPDEYTGWLLDAARRADPAAGGGLFHGLHGTVSVLADLGRREEAAELLDRVTDPPRSAVGLATGAAGAGIVRLRMGDLAAAVRIGEFLAGELPHPPDNAGLLDGMSGPALLHLALHRATGDERWLTAARVALAADLARCVTLPDGTVQVRRGDGTHLAYLGVGSAGVALVATAYLAAAGGGDEDLDALVGGAGKVCTSSFVREPGLVQGRAGLAATLAVLGAPRREVDRQVARLSWHLSHDSGALFVPGSQLLRFSEDLATGAAGVLLAVHLALGDAVVSPTAVLALD